DVFVARDTTAFSDYYYRLRDQGVIYQYALKYSDDYRLQLQRFDKVDALKNHLDQQSLLRGLLRFAKEKGISYNEKDFRRSQQYIEVELEAYIARNILDNEGFYPVFHEIDEVLKVAVS